MDNLTLRKEDLYQFTGSEIWFVHNWVRTVHYTQGVQYVAEKGEAYWLVDEIAFAQAKPEVRAEEFQCWKLVLDDNNGATLTCDDGNENVVFTKQIDFTDFPIKDFSLYYTNNVILLPSEY